MDEYKIKQIEEGLTKIEFPEFDKVSSEAPVFYNPHMEMNRDLSILAIQVFQKEQDREINICDLFGGSGIRGVRYKNEIDGVGTIHCCSSDKTASEFDIIRIKNPREVKTILSDLVEKQRVEKRQSRVKSHLVKRKKSQQKRLRLQHLALGESLNWHSDK